ncbi:trigger factor [bacterium (Candidatus Howlettbacteria) CG_4_10_14_0_8_um_filter_40_9]|nr:MAG: trigger factor [bacterium (Candidatus Howlettbacteria) CG_4_10_14_0_8_um_filter_40_9]
MDIKREDLKDSQVKLTIDIPAGMLHLYSEEAYKKLAPSVKIAGFRPGKAPRNMVEREIGSDAFNNEILNIAIQRTFYDAVIKENLTTVSPPDIKVLKFVPTDGLTYEAVVTILPEVKIPDLKSIKLKKQEIKIEPKEVESVIEDLRKQNAVYKEVKRDAKSGDKVEIDFHGLLKNIPFEGGTGKNHPLILGSGAMIPGFEDGIAGMKKDEEKDIKVTFPKEYHVEHLAGQEVIFKIKVNKIEEIILPEVDDKFAQSVTSYKTAKEMKEEIERSLKENKELQEKRRLEEELLKKAVTKAKIEAPKSLVDDEVHRMLHEAEHNLSHSGIELSKYLEHVKKTKEEFEKELLPEAENRVNVGLLLSEIVKENNFTVTDEEVNAEIEISLGYATADKKDEAKKYYESEDGRRSVENGFLSKKVMEWMMKEASVE